MERPRENKTTLVALLLHTQGDTYFIVLMYKS